MKKLFLAIVLMMSAHSAFACGDYPRYDRYTHRYYRGCGSYPSYERNDHYWARQNACERYTSCEGNQQLCMDVGLTPNQAEWCYSHTNNSYQEARCIEDAGRRYRY